MSSHPSALTSKKLEAVTRSIDHQCPNCHHQGLNIFYEVRNVPVHSCLMLSSAKEALNFPSGDVILAFCSHCGFITNTEFDTQWSAYSPNYEDQQSFSPTFNQFALDLANRLIETYDLHDKKIIEIGCSKGDFLLLLCERGNNTGVGIDPSVVPGRVTSIAADKVLFVPEYYSQEHAKYEGDFICCRHTLEHILPTHEFISTVRASIGDQLQTRVFFEIPDTVRVLKELAFEDIYYEHCTYLTPTSLAYLFRSCNFEVNELYRGYGDQYLMIEAAPVSSPSTKVHSLEESLEEITQNVINFTTQINQKLEFWEKRLNNWRKVNKKVVVWGSGSKCVAFLTTLDAIDSIDYVVDINPHRHGKFIPGVGKQIMAPEFLKDYQPDCVVVMNSIYCSEIQKMLERLEVSAEIYHL